MADHTEIRAAAHLDPLTRALAFAEAGVLVFPCQPGGKTPITRHGFHDATTDPKQIEQWWRSEPRANIATPTGAPGFDVLDVDVRADGDGWAAFRRAEQAGLLDGWMRAVRTPSGGLHLHYPGSEQRNGSLRNQHLDFRGRGGYVLLPPSQVGDRRYELTSYRSITGRPLDWNTVTRLVSPVRVRPVTNVIPRGADPVGQLAAYVARQREGNRDNALFWAACRAAESGAQDLRPLVTAAITAGLPEQQATRTVRSAENTVSGGVPARPRPHPSTSPKRGSELPMRSAS